MSGLSASVENGIVNQTTTTTTSSTKGTTDLGKDAFLQLLCAQLQYQDPLNPSTDTEFISQLAQYSSLEQMQNLNSSFTQSQAFSLIGSEVRVSADNSDGYVQGTVDYVSISNNTAYLSINGNLYSADKIITAIDSNYIASLKAPYIDTQTTSYNHDEPSDVQVKINLGEDDGAASSFAVVINGSAVDTSYLSYDSSSSTVTISKDAFSGLDAGTYKIMFAFDDTLSTTVTDKVSLTVTGTKPVTEESGDDAETSGDGEAAQE